jgi:hypothetical protein
LGDSTQKRYPMHIWWKMRLICEFVNSTFKSEYEFLWNSVGVNSGFNTTLKIQTIFCYHLLMVQIYLMQIWLKKRNFIIKCTTYVHILHTVLLDCNATSTPKLISWLIVKMSTGMHVLWSIVYLCIYKSCLGLVATRSICFAYGGHSTIRKHAHNYTQMIRTMYSTPQLITCSCVLLMLKCKQDNYILLFGVDNMLYFNYYFVII